MRVPSSSILRWGLFLTLAGVSWAALAALADWYTRVFVYTRTGWYRSAGWLAYSLLLVVSSVILIAAFLFVRRLGVPALFLLGGVLAIGVLFVTWRVFQEVQAGRCWMPDLVFLALGASLQFVLTLLMFRPQQIRRVGSP